MRMSTGKRNTEIRKIEERAARYVCFSKRREGLFKKVRKFHQVSGSHVAVLVCSSNGKPYIHGSPSFNSIIDAFLQSSVTATTPNCSVSDSFDVASTEEGLRLWVESINAEDFESVEELLEIKRRMEEAKDEVINNIVDCLLEEK